MPKFSVIIPIYRVEMYLPACIESVLNQDALADCEIILVDDGSPDGSGAICDDYAVRFSNICVIHSENHGVSHARNLGLSVAEGEYVLFLDADDLWECNMISTLLPLTATEPDMLVFGNVRLMENGEIRPGHLDPVIPEGERGAEFLQKLFALQVMPRAYPWCYGFRRQFLMEHGFRFREDMKVSEDFEFDFRCFAAAKSIIGTSARLYRYRCRENSASMCLSAKKLMDNLTAKAEVFYRYQTSAVANIYADNALLVANLPRSEADEAIAFLRRNRKIWDHVSQPPLKLGRVLVQVFGDYYGSQLFSMLRKVKRGM